MIRRSFFFSKWSAQAAGLAVAAAMMLPLAAQEPTPAAPAAQTTQDQAAPAQAAPAQADATLSNQPDKKKKKAKVAKTERVVQSKDTRAANRRQSKLDPLAGKDAGLPDKVLYDKALEQTKKGHFDVARLDLQTLLNTYPDSQYQMRAKLAIADSWFREGGSAALTQAEQEYNDFITFFPNAPEAAEAQMRVGDIYFKQMDVADRDYTKTIKAEEAYRLMIKQYPESALIKEARQKLREVQEVLAIRESELGLFYAQHENWPASIARYQTVADTYPLYSHMDDVLLGLGDAYAAEARLARAQTELPEAPKARILATYDNKAAEYYRACVLEHSASAHVEDCKERLESMGQTIPTPTPEQAAASEALEGSRAQYTFQNRIRILLTHKPDTVTTARAGDPPLDDPPATVAPTVTKALVAVYTGALNPRAAVAPAATTNTPAADTSATPTTPAPAANAPLAFQDVAAPGEGNTPDTTTMTGAAPASGGTTRGNSLGVEVLTPGVTTGGSAKGTAGDTSYGLKTVGNTTTTALPAVEKPTEAPDQVNDALGKKQPPAPQTTDTKKKPSKPAYDKDDESSSKHKKKKGLSKLNPL